MRGSRSIVRRGNHFIHCNAVGWVLIDGPWFDQLEEKAKKLDGICAVIIPRLVDEKCGRFYSTELPDDVAYVHYTRWQRISWHPGHITSKSQRDKLDSWTQHLLSLYEARRARHGWIVQGRLPAFINKVDAGDEQDWDRLLQEEEKNYI